MTERPYAFKRPALIEDSMSSVAAPKPIVLVPFVCPICAGQNAVALIALSRAGGVTCEACKKWLRATDVMRAMHAPRVAKSAK